MPEPVMITGSCPECRQDLEHCHGTAIEHCDGAADCSDSPDCGLPADLHLFVISCLDVGCDCAPAGMDLAGLDLAGMGQRAAS